MSASYSRSDYNVGIIGAGPAGLVAAKECLEAGLNPIIIEREHDLGGVWHPETGKTWNGMKTNLSRLHMGFSDYPFSETVGDFPRNTDVYAYLKSYAADFAVEPHIVYNQTITDMHYTMHDKAWNIQTNQDTHQFKNIIMAGGFFNTPHIPPIQGRDAFQGPVVNGCDYKNTDTMRDTDPVVIGGSFSAYEIASDMARNGLNVTHLFRTPAWIMKRYIHNNATDDVIPTDLLSYRYQSSKTPPASDSVKKLARSIFLENHFGNPGESHPALQVDDLHTIVIADDYRDLVEQKKITPIRGDIAHMNKTGCVLHDGRHIKGNYMTLCTGYAADIPSNDPALLDTIQYRAQDRFQTTVTGHGIHHPQAPGYYQVGFYRGPFFATMEMQARIAASHISGSINPSPKDWESWVDHEKTIRAQHPRPAFPRGNYVDFILNMSTVLDTTPHDLLERADSHTTRMLPADFRRFGIGAKPAIAEAQRARLDAYLCPKKP